MFSMSIIVLWLQWQFFGTNCFPEAQSLGYPRGSILSSRECNRGKCSTRCVQFVICVQLRHQPNKCFRASHLHCCRSNSNTVRTELSRYFTLTSGAERSSVGSVCIVKLVWQIRKSVSPMKPKCQEEALLLLRLLLLLSRHLILFQITDSSWSSSLLLCTQSALFLSWLSTRQF